jgi:WD40 repeat protein
MHDTNQCRPNASPEVPIRRQASALSASFAKMAVEAATSSAPMAVPGAPPVSPTGAQPTCGVMTKAEMVSVLEGHTGGVRTMTLSIDGRTLYSSGEDKSIRCV